MGRVAVNALALVARRPEQVRTLVAHEPPAPQDLPGRDVVLECCRDIHRTYPGSGFGPAMAKFLALVLHEGPFTADFVNRPAPDPADFGLPIGDDGSRDDPLLGRNINTCNAEAGDRKSNILFEWGLWMVVKPWRKIFVSERGNFEMSVLSLRERHRVVLQQ